MQPLADIDLTWNLAGYQIVIDKMVAVFENAKNKSIWPQEASLFSGALVRAEKRNVKVVAGVFGECNIECQNTVNLESCGTSSQNRLGKRLSVVIGDEKEVVISEIGPHDETVGVLSTTPSITLIAKEYIKHDIWGSYLIEALGEQKFINIP